MFSLKIAIRIGQLSLTYQLQELSLFSEFFQFERFHWMQRRNEWITRSAYHCAHEWPAWTSYFHRKVSATAIFTSGMKCKWCAPTCSIWNKSFLSDQCERSSGSDIQTKTTLARPSNVLKRAHAFTNLPWHRYKFIQFIMWSLTWLYKWSFLLFSLFKCSFDGFAACSLSLHVSLQEGNIGSFFQRVAVLTAVFLAGSARTDHCLGAS